MKPSKRGATTATRRSSSATTPGALMLRVIGAFADQLGLDAGALDLAGRDLDGIAVVAVSPS